MYRQYQEERVRYVVRRGWFPPGHTCDEDVYDLTDRTLFCISTSDSGRFLAGMRLTPVGDMDSCLSLQMLASNGAMARKVSSVLGSDRTVDAALSCGHLYDLTRLVSGLEDAADGLGCVTISRGLLDVFGLALRSTCQGTENTLWIFATHRPLLGFLDHMGVRYSVLHSGRVSSGDTEDTCFCLLRPDVEFDTMRATGAGAGDAAARRARLVGGILRSAMTD